MLHLQNLSELVAHGNQRQGQVACPTFSTLLLRWRSSRILVGTVFLGFPSIPDGLRTTACLEYKRHVGMHMSLLNVGAFLSVERKYVGALHGTFESYLVDTLGHRQRETTSFSAGEGVPRTPAHSRRPGDGRGGDPRTPARSMVEGTRRPQGRTSKRDVAWASSAPSSIGVVEPVLGASPRLVAGAALRCKAPGDALLAGPPEPDRVLSVPEIRSVGCSQVRRHRLRDPRA